MQRESLIKQCQMAGEEGKERKCAEWVISLRWVELTLMLLLPQFFLCEPEVPWLFSASLHLLCLRMIS